MTIPGNPYAKASEVLARVLLTRQTLWRWRQAGKIPVGRRYRGRQMLFSPVEVEVVETYANRLEAIESAGVRQLGLFDGTAPTRNGRTR